MELIRLLLGHLSRSAFARNLFFRLPIGLRLVIRRTLTVSPTQPASKSRKIEDLVLTLQKLLREGGLATKPLSWESPYFEPQIGSVRLSESPVDYKEFSKVTFDFWDTVIGRTRPAEGAKRLTAFRASLVIWKRNGFLGSRPKSSLLHEKRLTSEAEQVDSFGEAHIRLAIADMLRDQSLEDSYIDELVVAEVEDEKKYTKFLFDSSSSDLLQGRDIEIVSDFYMPGKELARILDSKAHNLKVTKFHSSADIKATKRNDGALYKALGLQGGQNWLHVGDSQHSDIQMAKKHGATTIQATRLNSTSWNQNDLNFDSMAIDFQAHHSTDEQGRYLLDVGVVAISLITFAIENALSRGKNQITYVSREGKTLFDIHKLLLPKFEELGLPVVEPFYFPCSRASVYFASYAEDLQAGLDEISIQYPIMTRDSLVDTLGLDEELSKRVFLRLGKFQKFRTRMTLDYLGDELIEDLRVYLKEQKALIQELVHQIGIEPGKTLICDLGWRGTINDSLNRVFEIEMPGIYLGLRAPLKGRSNFRAKAGLLFDEPSKREAPSYFEFVGPLERAFTLLDRSVIGYQKTSESILPVFSQQVDGPTIGRGQLTRRNLGNAVNSCWESMISCGLFGSESVEFCKAIIQNWMIGPTRFHSSTWFDEVHREGFGTNEVHYSILRPAPEWLTGDGQGAIRRAVLSSLWPEGYFSWVTSFVYMGGKNE